MKFWRSLLSPGEGRERRSGSCVRSESQASSSVPTRRRSSSSRGSTTSLSDDNCGVTFVELIKRPGTHLGVIVTGGRDTGLRPRIADLVTGSGPSGVTSCVWETSWSASTAGSAE